MIARGLWALTGLAFIAFAWVQLNDPDPWAWISIYAMTALAALQRAFSTKTPARGSWVIAAAALAWAALLAPHAFDGATFFDDEEAREMMGLILVAIVFAVIEISRQRTLKLD